MPPQLPQVIQRRYRVTENSFIARDVFRLMLECVDEAGPIPAFKAGQWVNMTLLNEDGSDWAKAAYSIASAPCKGTQVLELGVKVEGDYTKRALALQVGHEVKLQGPWGLFTAKPEQARHVMFAGGIGVTPFLCMLREHAGATDMTRQHPVVTDGTTVQSEYILFYSNRHLEETAYLEEMRVLAETHGSIRFIPTFTGPTPDGWDGECGRIGDVMLDRYLSDFTEGEYLLCGSKDFMEGIRGLLAAKGVDKKRVREEKFG